MKIGLVSGYPGWGLLARSAPWNKYQKDGCRILLACLLFSVSHPDENYRTSSLLTPFSIELLQELLYTLRTVSRSGEPFSEIKNSKTSASASVFTHLEGSASGIDFLLAYVSRVLVTTTAAMTFFPLPSSLMNSASLNSKDLLRP